MNLKTFTLVTAPSAEPVTLEDAKTYCRVDGTADDALLGSLIATARRSCEEYCKRAFITQSWKLVMDTFDEDRDDEIIPSSLHRAIKLSREPIQSITHIKTTDTANTQTTVAAQTYTLDANGGRVLLNSGFTWPTALRDYASVEVQYVCGYGTAAAVPEPIKQAILQYVQDMYTSKKCSLMPEGCKMLLAPFMAMEAFV